MIQPRRTPMKLPSCAAADARRDCPCRRDHGQRHHRPDGCHVVADPRQNCRSDREARPRQLAAESAVAASRQRTDPSGRRISGPVPAISGTSVTGDMGRSRMTLWAMPLRRARAGHRHRATRLLPITPEVTYDCIKRRPHPGHSILGRLSNTAGATGQT
jgi:hypothetical protein